MHDIWNPWHGCIKCSEGCQNCYMYFLDRMRNRSGSDIYCTKAGFAYPLSKDKEGKYKVKSGEMIRVCMTSDFFLEEADEWRDEAWKIMRQRRDVKFFLLTKRPQRVEACLPRGWGNGWENIFFNVTCENQARADERIPILLKLPFKHKGIMCAPFIGPVSIEKYLSDGQIEQVICGGENYDGARPCHFDWVKSLRNECVEHNITFAFIEICINLIVAALFRLFQAKCARRFASISRLEPLRLIALKYAQISSCVYARTEIFSTMPNVTRKIRFDGKICVIIDVHSCGGSVFLKLSESECKDGVLIWNENSSREKYLQGSVHCSRAGTCASRIQCLPMGSPRLKKAMTSLSSTRLSSGNILSGTAAISR